MRRRRSRVADNTTFTVGTLGTFTVTTAGVPAAALSETGALPMGVTFVDNLDGRPSPGTPDVGMGGTYVFTITATNDVVPDATQTFTLTVDEARRLQAPTTRRPRWARWARSR